MPKRSEGKKKGATTVEKAGRKGDEKVSKEKSPEFYQEIGKKSEPIGVEHTVEIHGREFYQETGHKGGDFDEKFLEENAQKSTEKSSKKTEPNRA